MNGQLKEIQELLDGLTADMTARIALVESGKRTDLADLQKRIGDISVEVINARPQSACFVPALKQLVVQLDEMAATLKKQNDKAA